MNKPNKTLTNPFKDRQKKIIWEQSQEYKDLEKARQNASKRAYWSDLEDQQDRMTDGSDEQGWDFEPEDENDQTD